ncbi:unnamed protein product [Orchesella dallaii]|uniref:Uncharacterized protein n=1 Tax=Orchesella dallaii TaxID=48710 RepID=A0ABP1PHB0_9HEXA
MSYLFVILSFMFATTFATNGTSPSQQLNVAPSALGSKEFGQLLTILSEMRVNMENLKSSINTFEQRISNLETKHKTLEENNNLKEELSTLKIELETLKTESSLRPAASSSQSQTAVLTRTVTQLSENVGTLLQESRSQFPEIRSDINSIRSSLQDLSRRAVTDVKLGPAEGKALWRNHGHFDHVPYVITEVSNFNADAYPDNVVRRRLMKLVDGSWRNLASG